MITKLQKLFHTDKWWGKTLFMVCFYIVFLFFGYWIWFLEIIPECINCDSSVMYIVSPLYFFIILPILSFVLVFFLNKKFYFNIKKILLIIINLLIIIANISLFFIAIIFSIRPNFF